MAIGWFGGDVVDAVVDVVTSVADDALDVVKAVPGSEELAGAIGPLITGPLRDFAESVAGKIILRAMATTIYGPLAWTIGPQVASIAFAVPGLARGEDFWHAWFDEVRWRTEKTAEILAPSLASGAADSLNGATQEIAKAFPGGWEGLSATEIAARLGISPTFATEEMKKRLGLTDEWAAAMVRNYLLPNSFPLPSRADFDPVSGNVRPGLRPPSKTSAAALAVSSVLGWQPPNVLLAKTAVAGSSVSGWQAPNVLAAKTSVAANPALVPTTAAAIAIGGAPPSSRKTAQDVALVGVIAVAIGTLAWWYTGEKKKKRRA